MSNFGLNVELDVDASAVGDLGVFAFEWFDVVSASALTEPRAALEGRGPAPAAPRFVEPAVWNSAGAPAWLWGSVDVASSRPRKYDAGTMDWLRGRLAEEPLEVNLQFGLVAGTEPDAPTAWWPSLYAHWPEDSLGWLRIGAHVAESLLLDPTHGPEAQQEWLRVLRMFAERANPGFGQIEYGYTWNATALEDALTPDLELGDRDPEFTVGQSRRYLRGYSWLTIVPAELVKPLGGAAALRAGGAFHQVAELANGGLWLLATADYRDYGMRQAAAVFRATAPVLRPGELIEDDGDPYGSPPHRLVFEDARSYHVD